MKLSTSGYRVAVVGASSLLGKELQAVLGERKFPVSHLIELGAGEDEPDLPILDLDASSQLPVEALAQAESERVDETEGPADVDLVFVTGRSGRTPWFLSPASQPAPVVIDLGENSTPGSAQEPARAPDEFLSVPFLDREFQSGPPPLGSKNYVSPHPAVIIISSLLLRLGARFPVRTAVAQVFAPASELGPRAIQELQAQTVNLLSFQKIPTSIFGAQLAFNVLPRLARARRSASDTYRDGLTDLEGHIRAQLKSYLGGRTALPALRVIQVPVFYALTVSLYVETEQPMGRESAGQVLSGGRVRVRRVSDQAPSQIDVTGTSDILVDAVTVDAGHPGGLWLWATSDNLHLAAANAVEIAESVKEQGLPARH